MSKSKGKVVSAVMIITLGSKCLGFLRDFVLAYYFGAGNVTDAYLVSQTIPEFLFSLVVQAISISYIPIYMEIVQKQNKVQAAEFTDKLMTLCLSLCAILAVTVNIFGRQIVALFASGFEPQTAILATKFVQITVFAMFTRICTTVWSCYLQANGQFTVPALLGIPFDIIVILSIVVAYYTSSYVLAYGLVFASASQACITYFAAHRQKPKYRFHRNFLLDPHIKKMLLLVLPLSLGVGANQINVLVDRTVASGFMGGISSLNYANKVDNVLENIIILSLATVLFPTFAEYATRKDFAALRESSKRAMDIVILFMAPVSIFSALFAPQIIQILFGRGQFDAYAVEQTVIAMRFYSIGLLFLSLHAILTRIFYALQLVQVVTVNSCIAVAINVVLNFILSKMIGFGGIALATSVANIYTAASLLILLHRKIECSQIYKALGVDFVKILTVSVLLAGAAYGGYKLLLGQFTPVLSFIIVMLIFCPAYIVLANILKVDGVKQVVQMLKRKKAN